MDKSFYVSLDANTTLIIEAKDVELKENGDIIFYSPNIHYPDGKEIIAFVKKESYKFFTKSNGGVKCS